VEGDRRESPPDEPQRDEIILDPRVADELGVSVGDTIYVGTSRHTAETNELTVIGISGYYSQYLGSPAVTVPLGDLQAIAARRGPIGQRTSPPTWRTAPTATPSRPTSARRIQSTTFGPATIRYSRCSRSARWCSRAARRWSGSPSSAGSS